MEVRGQNKKIMASSTQILAIFLGSFQFVQRVTGYYCDNDKCREDEFCCGENTCCVSYKVWELWYFWCGILFFLLLLSLCGIFWRQRSRAHWVFKVPTPYSPLTLDEEPKYSPNRKDPYISTKEKTGSPSYFYHPTDKQLPWFSHSPKEGLSPQPYTDNDSLYEEERNRKVDY